MAKNIYITKETYRPYVNEYIDTYEEANEKIADFDKIIEDAIAAVGGGYKMIDSDDRYLNICHEWISVGGKNENRVSEMTKEEVEKYVWVYTNVFEKHTIKHVRIYTREYVVQIPLISE